MDCRYVTAATGGTAGPAAGIAVLGATAFISGGASYGAYASLKYNCVYSIPIPTLIPSSTILRKLSERIMMEEGELIAIDSLIYRKKNYEHIGEIHNEILEEIISLEPNTRTIETTCYMDSKEAAFFTNNQLKDMYQNVNSKIQTYIDNGYNYDALISELSKNKLTTKNTEDILSLYLEMLFKYVNDVKDLRIVSDTYEKIIIDSKNLSLDDKNMLLISIYTAISSLELWKKN